MTLKVNEEFSSGAPSPSRTPSLSQGVCSGPFIDFWALGSRMGAEGFGGEKGDGRSPLGAQRSTGGGQPKDDCQDSTRSEERR